MIDKKIKYVNKFYNNFGWEKKDKNTLDANLFEDLRLNSQEYVSKCRKRLLKYIPGKGTHILDFASGPIQYPEYLEYSKNFKLRHCVDFSRTAIKNARQKLNKKGKFYCNDFFKVKLRKNYFDCIISLHTIYHIDKKYQTKAVKKLIEVSKKNSPIIIVYSNPNTFISKIKRNFFNLKKKNKNNLYFFCHPINWWFQFEKIASIKIEPWRSFSSDHQKKIFPDNFIGKILLRFLFFLEDLFKNFFINNFQYYTVIIKKK